MRSAEPLRRCGRAERRLVELGQARKRLGRVPHPRERRFVGRRDHGVAERAALRVLFLLHLDAEQPLEHRIARLAVAIATHRLLDP
jgi:hypothetical protein